MDRDLLKTIILGASIIISMLIYSDANKYEKYDYQSDDSIKFSVLNKRTGEVRTYILTNADSYVWQTFFNNSKVALIQDSLVIKNDVD